MIYKVQIQIQQLDEEKGSCLAVGRSYEAGKFYSEKAARKFVENELMIIRQVNVRLRNACRSMLRFLDTLGTANMMATLKSLQVCLRMMKEAMNSKSPPIDDSCPKCGAGSGQRELAKRDFLDVEAVHMHYICNRCGSEIIEEYTLSDVFIDRLTI